MGVARGREKVDLGCGFKMKTREAWGLARRPEEPLAAPTTGAPPISSPGPRQGRSRGLALSKTRGTKSHRYWTQGVGGVEAKRES